MSKMEIPRSLKNIYRELQDTVPGFVAPASADLTPWAKQGVLLLNSALTVRAGAANSHSSIGRQYLTDRIIQILGTNNAPIAFCLWGAFTQQKKKYITGTHKLILEASHPSPLSARHSFFGCNHFNKVNEFLAENNVEPIDWRLKGGLL